MKTREAAAAARAQLRRGYFDQRSSGGNVYVVCAAPCRERVAIDRFTRRTELLQALEDALAVHLQEEH